MSNTDLTWQIHLSMVCLHNLFIPPIRKYALNPPLRSVAQLLIGLRVHVHVHISIELYKFQSELSIFLLKTGRGGSNEYQQPMVWTKISKIGKIPLFILVHYMHYNAERVTPFSFLLFAILGSACLQTEQVDWSEWLPFENSLYINRRLYFVCFPSKHVLVVFVSFHDHCLVLL